MFFAKPGSWVDFWTLFGASNQLLAALTLLDHQNTGAGAPCVAAGMCEPGNEPADIIDPSCKTETVAITPYIATNESTWVSPDVPSLADGLRMLKEQAHRTPPGGLYSPPCVSP